LLVPNAILPKSFRYTWFPRWAEFRREIYNFDADDTTKCSGEFL